MGGYESTCHDFTPPTKCLAKKSEFGQGRHAKAERTRKKHDLAGEYKESAHFQGKAVEAHANVMNGSLAREVGDANLFH